MKDRKALEYVDTKPVAECAARWSILTIFHRPGVIDQVLAIRTPE
jgi:hypothetical protein